MKLWIWPILLALTIYFASGGNPVAGPNIVNLDKLIHFSVFGLIATVVVRCRKPVTWAWALSAFLIVSGYGILDEFRQSFTPGRSVDSLDWIADTLGALVAILLYKLVPCYASLLETKIPSKTRQSGQENKNEIP